MPLGRIVRRFGQPHDVVQLENVMGLVAVEDHRPAGRNGGVDGGHGDVLLGLDQRHRLSIAVAVGAHLALFRSTSK